MNKTILTSLCALLAAAGAAHAQGTGFTYQGRLDTGAGTATGNYSLQFQLYSNATAGQPVSAPLPVNTWVSNGLFMVTLDFGVSPFTGQPLWLQMWIAPSNSPSLTPSLLSPRQPLTPAPYAIFARSASNTTANAVGNAALQNNAVTADKIAVGQVVKSLNGLRDAVSLTAGANVTITPSGNSLQISATGGGGSSWGITGNAGTTPGANYIGASDNAQVRLHATGGFLVDDTTPGLFFGVTRRQMINLWAAEYGIGIQDFTLYQRSDNQFNWYRRGSHVNAANDPGTGGLLVMNLDSAGSLFLNSSLVVDRTNANNGGLYPGLIFAPNSGEGMASKRTAGGNQYGVDLYTAFLPRLSIANWGGVGIGTTAPEDGLLDIEGDTHINDHDLFMRGGSDRNHGIGYRGSAAGQSIDGPFIYGFNGGALGAAGPDSISLRWDWTGNVWVSNNVNAASLTVRGDTDLSGVTRTLGGLVIENRTSDPASPATGRIWLRTDL